MKKYISIVVALALFFSILILGVPQLSADAANNYTYTLEDGKAHIKGYTGKGGAITVPATLGGKPVISIEVGAFIDNTNITSVTLPNGLVEIGDSAFFGCTQLSSVILPNTLRIVGNSAFVDCSKLASLDIPASIEDIGMAYSNVFSGCNSLSGITVDPANRMFSSLDGVLYDKKKTTLVYFPNHKFSASFSFPASVTTVGPSAFESCNTITTMALPSGIKTIEHDAFSNCNQLTSVTIPDSVESLGEAAFMGSEKLSEVSIGKALKTMGRSVFLGCKSLKTIKVDSANTAYCTTDGILFTKDKTTLLQYPCYRKGAYVVPDGVATLGMDAFSYGNIGALTFSKTVKTIDNALINCMNLTQLTVDSRNPWFTSQNNVLFNKERTKLIFCPAGLSGSYSVPSTVTWIEKNAFSACNKLTKITLPNSITSIGTAAFSSCEALREINIPTGLTGLDQALFIYCKSLKSITIPSNITYLGDLLFASCESLTTVKIPNSVTNVGVGTFSRCTALVNISLPNTIYQLGMDAFEGCTSLKSIQLPETIKEIKTYTFYNCTSLTKIDLSSVTSIDEKAFTGCTALESAVIGSSVYKLGNQAFSGCPKLENMYFLGDAPTLGTDCFLDCSKNLKLWYLKDASGFEVYIDNTTGVFAISEAPKLQASTTQLTSGTVTVAITYPSNAVAKEYFTGEGKWMPYTGPIKLTANNNIVARYYDAAGKPSDTGYLNVDNIDRTAPAITVKAPSGARITNGGTVKATYVIISAKDAHMASTTVSLNNKPIAYPKGGKCTSKGTYTIRCTDKVGNKSEFQFTLK